MQPVANNIVVVLLGPQQAGKGLAHHVARVIVCGGRNDAGVERVGFSFARGKCVFEFLAQSGGCSSSRLVFAKPQLNGDFSTWRHGEFVLNCGFGAFELRIHCRCLTVDHITMKRVLDVRRSDSLRRRAVRCWFRFQ